MFEGFTPETVDFLWGIRMNNNRDWFLEHKKDYVTHLYEPMKELGKEVFVPFQDKPGTVLKVSRIYRDARLHHPLPYKESLWICIRQDGVSWGENPCLFFEIRPEGVSYGFSLWKPGIDTVEKIRQAMAARPGEFLELLSKTEAATGIPVTGESYKRLKEAPVPELAPYYSWKGKIRCIREEPVGPELFGPELGRRAATFIEQLIPLYDYFCRVGKA